MISSGPAQLIGRLTSHNDIVEIGQGPRDDEVGLPHPEPERVDRPIALEFPLGLRRVAADADHADAELVAEAVGDLAPGRRHLELQQDAAAVDLETELVIGAGADDTLHVGKGLDPLPVDADDLPGDGDDVFRRAPVMLDAIAAGFKI